MPEDYPDPEVIFIAQNLTSYQVPRTLYSLTTYQVPSTKYKA